jgi:hypothetical protein
MRVAGVFVVAPSLLAGAPTGRRRQLDTGTPSLRKPDGNGLFRGPCPVLAFTDVMKLLAHEFTGLGRGGFAFPFIFAGPFDGTLIWHDEVISQNHAESSRMGLENTGSKPGELHR